MTNNLVKRLELSSTFRDAITETSFDEVWTLPTITPALRNEARRQLASAESELEPARKSDVRKWLVSLAVLCSGNLSVANTKEKMVAYSHLLSYAPVMFTEETLELAGRKFTWFPSYGELCAYLDELELPFRNRAARIALISKAPVEDAPKSRQEPLDERRAHTEKIMREFTASMSINNT